MDTVLVVSSSSTREEILERLSLRWEFRERSGVDSCWESVGVEGESVGTVSEVSVAELVMVGIDGHGLGEEGGFGEGVVGV